jgi:drug/metabolite transporter, DME family
VLLLPGHAGRANGAGVILAIAAAACYAVYTVSAKRLADDLADDGAAMTGAVAITLIAGGLLLTPRLVTAGTLSLAEPLVAALAGIGFLQEHLAVPAVIGCGLLAVGLAFTSLRSSPARSRDRHAGAAAGSAPDVAATAPKGPAVASEHISNNYDQTFRFALPPGHYVIAGRYDRSSGYGPFSEVTVTAGATIRVELPNVCL